MACKTKLIAVYTIGKTAKTKLFCKHKTFNFRLTSLKCLGITFCPKKKKNIFYLKARV